MSKVLSLVGLYEDCTVDIEKGIKDTEKEFYNDGQRIEVTNKDELFNVMCDQLKEFKSFMIGCGYEIDDESGPENEFFGLVLSNDIEVTNIVIWSVEMDMVISIEYTGQLFKNN